MARSGNATTRLVIGGGIAGMQAALDLGEQGYEVLLVEQRALDRRRHGGPQQGVPDPRLLELHLHAAHGGGGPPPAHPAPDLHRGAEGREGRRRASAVELLRKPRYVVEDDCIGCDLCELACPDRRPARVRLRAGRAAGRLHPARQRHPPEGGAGPRALRLLRQVREGLPDRLRSTSRSSRGGRRDEVGAVIVATGLQITPMDRQEGVRGRHASSNVMNPLAMERLQSSNGPYGRVLRPSDGKIPRSIAYVQCAGSRDRSIGVPYCSRVCCMYALKQAMLLTPLHPRRGGHPLLHGHPGLRQGLRAVLPARRRARACGWSRARSRGSRRRRTTTSSCAWSCIDEDGRVEEQRHDLVVLAQGLVPGWHAGRASSTSRRRRTGSLTPEAKLNPSYHDDGGRLRGGVAAGPKDIPDAIVEAGEAAMAAANYLERTGGARGRSGPRRPRARKAGGRGRARRAGVGRTVGMTTAPWPRNRGARSRRCGRAVAASPRR